MILLNSNESKQSINYIYILGTTVLLMKPNNEAGSRTQCHLVAAGIIVDVESMTMQVNPGPSEVAVQVAAVINASSPLTEDQCNLHIGQQAIWAKKEVSIFQNNPVVVHVCNQPEGRCSVFSYSYMHVVQMLITLTT